MKNKATLLNLVNNSEKPLAQRLSEEIPDIETTFLLQTQIDAAIFEDQLKLTRSNGEWTATIGLDIKPQHTADDAAQKLADFMEAMASVIRNNSFGQMDLDSIK